MRNSHSAGHGVRRIDVGQDGCPATGETNDLALPERLGVDVRRVRRDLLRNLGDHDGELQVGDVGLLRHQPQVDHIVVVDALVERDPDENVLGAEPKLVAVVLDVVSGHEPIDDDDSMPDESFVAPVAVVLHGVDGALDLRMGRQRWHDENVAQLERCLHRVIGDLVAGVDDYEDREAGGRSQDVLGDVIAVAFATGQGVGRNQLNGEAV